MSAWEYRLKRQEEAAASSCGHTSIEIEKVGGTDPDYMRAGDLKLVCRHCQCTVSYDATAWAKKQDAKNRSAARPTAGWEAADDWGVLVHRDTEEEIRARAIKRHDLYFQNADGEIVRVLFPNWRREQVEDCLLYTSPSPRD